MRQQTKSKSKKQKKKKSQNQLCFPGLSFFVSDSNNKNKRATPKIETSQSPQAAPEKSKKTKKITRA